jgi:hypothetical protein
MNRRRNANEKVLQISFVPAHSLSLMIILITHVNAPRSKNIMCVCILDMKGARTRAKWLGGCISAEYTKGALARRRLLLLPVGKIAF